jgi:hypothetical protein
VSVAMDRRARAEPRFGDFGADSAMNGARFGDVSAHALRRTWRPFGAGRRQTCAVGANPEGRRRSAPGRRRLAPSRRQSAVGAPAAAAPPPGRRVGDSFSVRYRGPLSVWEKKCPLRELLFAM